jgi:hypothetical protein
MMKNNQPLDCKEMQQLQLSPLRKIMRHYEGYSGLTSESVHRDETGATEAERDCSDSDSSGDEREIFLPRNALRSSEKILAKQTLPSLCQRLHFSGETAEQQGETQDDIHQYFYESISSASLKGQLLSDAMNSRLQRQMQVII